MDCNLQKAEQIIEQDTNGKELTDKNYQEVESLLTCEIKQLTRALTGVKGS